MVYHLTTTTRLSSGVLREAHGGHPEFVRTTDQFVWFRTAMIRAIDASRRRERYSLFSAVRFHLPYIQGNPQNHLVVLGDGWNLCDVYLARIYWNAFPHTSSLWKLFAYNGCNTQEKSYNFRRPPRKPLDFASVFSTDIMPFRHDGEPQGSHTRYTFQLKCSGVLGNSDYVQVVAKDREHFRQLEVHFHSGETGKKKHIITLKEQNTWHSPTLEDRIVVHDFTFAPIGPPKDIHPVA